MTTETVAAAIRESGVTRTALRIRAARTGRRRERARRKGSLAADDMVCELRPGDRTRPCARGTSLEIERVTLEHDKAYATLRSSAARSERQSKGFDRLGSGLDWRENSCSVRVVNGRGEIRARRSKVVKRRRFDCAAPYRFVGFAGVITEVTLGCMRLARSDRTSSRVEGRPGDGAGAAAYTWLTRTRCS